MKRWLINYKFTTLHAYVAHKRLPFFHTHDKVLFNMSTQEIPCMIQEDEDEYIKRIKRSGCFPQHERLQDCYWEKKDWRHCRQEMIQFKQCFMKGHAKEQFIEEHDR